MRFERLQSVATSVVKSALLALPQEIRDEAADCRIEFCEMDALIDIDEDLDPDLVGLFDGNAPFDPHGHSFVSRVLDEQPDAGEAAIAQERIELLADALMSLPARCRDVTVLHKVKGLTQREIALQLGISERTVETHVRVGVARCHAYLRDHGMKPLKDDET